MIIVMHFSYPIPQGTRPTIQSSMSLLIHPKLILLVLEYSFRDYSLYSIKITLMCSIQNTFLMVDAYLIEKGETK